MFQAGLLANKKILITGGGTGLGAAMGRRFAELGAELVICGRRGAVLEETAGKWRAELGAKVATIVCDVRDASAVESMMDAIWRDGPLDVLVNNAAGNFIAQSHKLSPRALDSVLGIVLHGSGYCTFACGRRWIEAGRKATVLSILTLSALQGGAFRTPSAMAKAGVLAMTRSLAVEWGPKGIRCVAVAPGPFPTPGASQRLTPAGGRQRPIGAEIPLGRVGEHIELANLCSYLVSDQAAYINGDCIIIDGGKHLLGDGGSSTDMLLGWSDAEWDQMRRQAAGRT
ncbi:MAG TPA: SDR family oxidoreductase [Candidatus Cybelea sp.]|nr:SDR family oxidoreductase [Candidatus Cybelea sp.]